MSEHRTPSIPRCGEIWTCHLGEHGPGVQSGYRPVLILSNDQNNLFSSVVNVAPLTSKMHKRSLPVHVELWDYEAYGLKSPSTILIEQTTTIQMNCLDFMIKKSWNRYGWQLKFSLQSEKTRHIRKHHDKLFCC